MSSRKTLLTNFFSLSGLQLVNFAMPLITVPYVVRIIGPSDYGLVNFASAFVMYFTMFVNFGFDWSATREIAECKDDTEKVNEIFNSVFFAKSLIFIVSTVIFGVCVLTISKFRENQLVFIFVYIAVLGGTFFPTWYFQGIEKLSATAVINFIVRLLFTASIFIFIREKQDFLLYVLISSLGILAGGLMAFVYALKRFHLHLKIPKLANIKHEYRKGLVIFTSTVVINIYTASNTVVLGFFAQSINVGFFSGAMKFVAVLQGLIAVPLGQSLYPHISASFKESYERGIVNLKKATIVVGGLTFAGSVAMFLGAGLAVRIVLGDKFLPAIFTLRLLAFMPFIVGLSNVFGVQGLLNLHKDRAFFKVTALGAVLDLVLNFVLTPPFLQNGTALSSMLTETFITGALYFVLLKEGINLLDLKFIKAAVWRRIRPPERSSSW